MKIPLTQPTSTGPDQEYFNDIRQKAATHPEIITPQNESVITVDIDPVVLMDKLKDVQWERLPKEVVDACGALPAFKVRQLLDDVAKGKQDEADGILKSATDIQSLLRTPGKLTDYSGRTFHCTAYEYAWWAKDTRMRRMLEGYMDDETKTQMLEKIDAIERSGLAYQQHEVSYQNPHYDMSFVLKDVSLEELNHLKIVLGQNNEKINSATADNYQTISFTATEYEELKKELAQQNVWGLMPSCSAYFQCLCYLAYPVFFIASLFITSPTEKLSKKLPFDFRSLITTLKTYENHYDRRGYDERKMAWLEVGKAQRDVPAHVAQEYCRIVSNRRPFMLSNSKLCEFNSENKLVRNLKFFNICTNDFQSWFPLDAFTSSSLGVDFAITNRRGHGYYINNNRAELISAEALDGWTAATREVKIDEGPGEESMGVSKLDTERTIDLTQSRDELMLRDVKLGIGRFG